MRCPACTGALAPVANRSGLAASCERCGGIWIDRACEEAIAKRTLDDAVIAACHTGIALARARREAGGVFRAADERPSGERRCAVCDGYLTLVSFGTGRVGVDVCAAHGTWLDVGETWTIVQEVELDDAVRRARNAPRDPVPPGPTTTLDFLLSLLPRP